MHSTREIQLKETCGQPQVGSQFMLAFLNGKNGENLVNQNSNKKPAQCYTEAKLHKQQRRNYLGSVADQKLEERQQHHKARTESKSWFTLC